MLRKERKITQAELATYMSISQHELSSIERGTRNLKFEKIGSYLSGLNSSVSLSKMDWNRFIEAFISDTIFKWIEGASFPIYIIRNIKNYSVSIAGETEIPLDVKIRHYQDLFKGDYFSPIVKILNADTAVREAVLKILDNPSICEAMANLSDEHINLVESLLIALKR